MHRDNTKVKFRLANESDSQILFDWVNEKEVRRNSLNIQLVQWGKHVSWFNSKLESNKCKIFVLEIEDVPVGQIRIDKEDEYWLIDYSIDKNHRGNGYGYLIIDLLIKNIGSIKLKGVVKTSNVASQKVFEKLEFKANRNKNLIQFVYSLK